MYTFPYSLEGNGIGNSGATALADALRVNKSLKTLRYIYLTARHFPRDTSQNYLKQHKFLLLKVFSLVQKLLASDPCLLSAGVQLCQAVTSNWAYSCKEVLHQYSSIQYAFENLRNGHSLSIVKPWKCFCKMFIHDCSNITFVLGKFSPYSGTGVGLDSVVWLILNWTT